MVTLCGLRGGLRLTFQHDIEGPVFVAGSFNNWSTSAAPMQQTEKGRWEIVLDLPPGEHQFRYYANGQWFTDYAADGIERNALGQYNSIIIVREAGNAPATEKQLPGLKIRRPRSHAPQVGLAGSDEKVIARISAIS